MKKILSVILAILIFIPSLGVMIFGADYIPDISDLDSNGIDASEITLDYKIGDHLDEFYSPAYSYREQLMYHSLPKKAIDLGADAYTRYINELYAKGLGGFVTNVPVGSDYINAPAGFDYLENATNFFLSKGMNIWLYDELGYPSGTAGGRVTCQNKDYVAKGLVCTAVSGEGAQPYTFAKDTSNPEIIGIYSAYAVDSNGNTHAVQTDGNTASFGGTAGKWTLYVFQQKYMFEGTMAQNNGYASKDYLKCLDYVNLMNGDATDLFIELVYKQYAQKFVSFDKVIAIFTDEPSLVEAYDNNVTAKAFDYAQISWVEGLEAEFEQMHGYSISKKLHCLFSGTDTESKTVRVNYRQTVGTLVADNYFKKLSDFCESNGTKLSGHLLYEEPISKHAYYYGDLMQSLRQMDISGVDCLTGNKDDFLNPQWPYYLAVKYAFSAATVANKGRDVMMEFCPTDYSAGEVLTAEEITHYKATMSMIYFHGANTVNSYFEFDKLGDGRRALSDYFGRIAYMSKNSEWDSGVGVYYPINTIQAYSAPSDGLNSAMSMPNTDIGAVCLTLTRNQLDYVIADNQFILEAAIGGGKLYTSNVSLSAIVVPNAEVMPLAVLQKLVAFKNNGGTVIFVGKVPSLSDKISDNAALNSIASTLSATEFGAAQISKIKASLGDKLTVTKTTSNVFMSKYTFDGAPMYWIYNNESSSRTLSLSYIGAKGYDIYDPATGKVTRVKGSTASVTADGYGTVFAVVLY